MTDNESLGYGLIIGAALIAGAVIVSQTGQHEKIERIPVINASKDAQAYISEKIAILMDEGYPMNEAQAIAYKYARAQGYRV